jgi:pSer/pThr/pTyr-binding forkhead associated (FHA) protein
LGRSQDSAIPLLSTSISRNHVQIEVTDRGILLTDLNSNNGTEIDGTKIPPDRKVRLKTTNKVRLGGFPELMSFEVIPTPMELLKSEDQRRQITEIMTHLRKELEDDHDRHLKAEMERLNIRASSDYKRLMLQADAEIKKLKREHETEIRRSLEDLKKKQEEIVKQAEEEARLIQDMALANEMKRKTELQEKLEEIERQTYEEIAKARSEGQNEADTVLDEARKRATAELQDAHLKADKILLDA